MTDYDSDGDGDDDDASVMWPAARKLKRDGHILRPRYNMQLVISCVGERKYSDKIPVIRESPAVSTVQCQVMVLISWQ